MSETTPPPAAAADSPAPPARLLCVDDEPAILSALKRVFRSQGYAMRTATSAREALDMLAQEEADVVVSDMRMPEMDGAQFLEQVFKRWPNTKRILLTGYADASATVAAINLGKIWRYVAKPWNDDELLLTVQQALAHRQLLAENSRLSALTLAQNEELKELNAGLEKKVAERTTALQQANAELHQSLLATVQVFSSLIEMREGRLAGHARRVADLARRLAERLGLDDVEQRTVLIAGLLHDIGKVGLPDKMLGLAFNALSPMDKVEMMRHPVKGAHLLTGIPQLVEAARLIRHHHECMDGSGYPDQLGGLMIPLGARIIALANDYDALQAGSLALHAHTPKEAREFIVKGRGKRYDPAVVDAFMAMMTESESKREVEVAVTADALHPGMVLTRDLMHRDGYLLLEKGRIVSAPVIAQLVRLQESEGQTLTIHVRRGSGAAVTRSKVEAPPSRGYREVPLTSARLKDGMTLARDLYHREGYLLLARGNHLDDGIIRQLRDIETSCQHAFTVYIRADDR